MLSIALSDPQFIVEASGSLRRPIREATVGPLSCGSLEPQRRLRQNTLKLGLRVYCGKSLKL